ncbi:helix-turn-helix transcriptional regulator [Mesobacterium pallidum]|uniref:helix-turn-helix transcriptional regulator n=1 Tax=Mesobacterium pallidum TaxID=2872037 RepID=UPI001EE1EAEF|nr:helix-turn-helix transcriptional regulator [Mesobacterium pallidum]
MTQRPALDGPGRQGAGLAALILLQIACAGFFVWDAGQDLIDSGSFRPDLHLGIEMVAAVSLIFAVGFEIRALGRLLRRQARIERGLQVASGALNDLIDAWFEDWGLTPAEQDVAAFTLKGFSIAEVAALRGAAEGTVKAQLNAIYRKAGVSGRNELLSLLIEDLMAVPLLDSQGRAAPRPDA